MALSFLELQIGDLWKHHPEIMKKSSDFMCLFGGFIDDVFHSLNPWKKPKTLEKRAVTVESH